MTEELIEAVARAICASEGKDPDFDYNPRGLGGWEPGTDLRWKCYRKSAQAAITAYEAARGDGIAEALAETKRLEENAKDAFARGYVDAQGAMIAASQGER